MSKISESLEDYISRLQNKLGAINISVRIGHRDTFDAIVKDVKVDKATGEPRWKGFPLTYATGSYAPAIIDCEVSDADDNSYSAKFIFTDKDLKD